MALLQTGTPDYTMGFSEAFLQVLQMNSAEGDVAYLLPYLRPGLRVLDFGCGPGAISVGLAKTVAPGRLHGIDMEQSQIDLARSAATAHGCDNAVFDVGDVTDLPFADAFFDAAHCHNVLMHVPDTAAALAEVKRVLKPGGVIGCREIICDASFTHPDFGVLQHSWLMFEDLLTSDDGHPQMGKELKSRLLEAGFANVKATASFDNHSSPDAVELVYSFANEWFLSPEITEAAIKYGASTAELCYRIAAAFERWRDHPGAFCAVAHGEAVAIKPRL